MNIQNNEKLKYKRIGCVIDYSSTLAPQAFQEICAVHPNIDFIQITSDNMNVATNSYDLIITIGGDGTMLKTMHNFLHSNIPIYGINRGSLGFLLNEYKPKELLSNLQGATASVIHPLMMEVKTASGEICTALAINEVSLIRQTQQSAKVQISINGQVRLDQMIGDGIILATATGSTAYNFAAHGPIVPLDANLLLLTPISPFRPRRWNGAILPRKSEVHFLILEAKKRPVSAAADFIEVRDAIEVKISLKHDIKIKLLFDSRNTYEERILREQFTYQ